MIRGGSESFEPWEETSPTYLDEGWCPPRHDSEMAEVELPDVTLVQPYVGPEETRTETSNGPAYRFGAGVPDLWEIQKARMPSARRSHRRPSKAPLQRFWFALLLLLFSIGFLGWRFWLAPPLNIQGTSFDSPLERLTCGETAQIVATINTNGAEGVIRYQWVRSDGTSSSKLRETLPRGTESVQVHTSWSFSGPGKRKAWATLKFIEPKAEAATTTVMYSCV